jgi:Helix-turn-helix domain, rpiR family
MSREPEVSAGDRKLSVEQLLQRISEEYEGLSKQLKIIARHIERNRDRLGIEGIRELAEQCEVQPSAVVRFAKHFGLSGFAEMQRIFRDGLAQYLGQSRNYETRIRKGIESGAGRLSSAEIADEFLRGSIAGMQELRDRLHGTCWRKPMRSPSADRAAPSRSPYISNMPSSTPTSASRSSRPWAACSRASCARCARAT